MTEWEVFEFFADARKDSVSRTFSNAFRSERPDVLATCSKLGNVGIEITDARPQLSEDEIDFAENWLDQEVFDYLDATDQIYHAIAWKEKKRTSPGWQRPDSTILLIRSFANIREVREHYGSMERKECLPEHGFKEIWIQDYELTFWKDGDVLGSAILCLHPPYWWRRARILSLHRSPLLPFTVRHDYTG